MYLKDTEEGVEVVWNEVRFSERKNFKSQEEKIRQVFDNLINLEHPNIVKFHKYWISRDDKPRVYIKQLIFHIRILKLCLYTQRLCFNT